MAVACVLNGWLHFGQLDHSHSIDGAFAIGYRLLDDQDELWSRRFLRLKGGDGTSRNAALAVMGVATPVLLDALQLDGKDVTFVPALRSQERTASPSGTLSILAKHCADRCRSEHSLSLLSKRPHERLHMPPRTVPERIAILESADYQAGKVTTEYVFVVDDLITTGLTLSFIAGAIENQNPQVRVYGLAPGKHAYLSHFGADRQHFPNGHIPPEWDQLWNEHETGSNA